jgi:hypothetical protein
MNQEVNKILDQGLIYKISGQDDAITLTLIRAIRESSLDLRGSIPYTILKTVEEADLHFGLLLGEVSPKTSGYLRH